MTLTGNDTVANYQKALRAVKYQNTAANPSKATRTVTFQVSDGQKPSKSLSRKIQWATDAAIAGPAWSVSAARKARASIHDVALLTMSWPAALGAGLPTPPIA
jgi:hypothetical protein